MFNELIPKIQIKPSSNTVYSYSKQEIKQDDSSIIKSDYSVTPQLINQPTPDEIVRREISHASPEEKVKILETAFRQDRFRELEDEQINALQSILEQSRREVNLANSAYTQGKLSNRKTNVFIVAAVFIAIATGSFFVVTHQATLNHQPNPTIPSNNYK